MKIHKNGHVYELAHLGGNNTQFLSFVDRGHGCDNQGTTNQEVLKALINRVKFLHNEKPHEVNAKILHHLRMALVLHEVRAIEQKVIKGTLLPENVEVNEKDLHFKLC